MEVKWKSLSKSRKNRPSPRIRWRMLEKEEYACNFKVKVVEKMIEMNARLDKSVDGWWSEMANYIRKIAREVLGETKGKGIIERDTWWWSDEVQKALKEKKDAFKAWKNEKVCERMKEVKMHEYKEWKKKAKKAVAVARAQAQYNIFKHLHEPTALQRPGKKAQKT
ncbi:unnamed protein product [Arctia plantaginis]|uniref:Uncharacterized protein n=1 Tax=Arctia plantaginis TaxID=874455 RepID=A0A8S1ATU3_ARCPL|nr:unnamed protein product [Arctia plantaginis]